MAAHSEQILDGSMERKKPLGVTRRFESSHLSLPLAGWLMRDFGSIVGIPFHAVSHVAEDCPSRKFDCDPIAVDGMEN